MLFCRNFQEFFGDGGIRDAGIEEKIFIEHVIGAEQLVLEEHDERA